MYIDSNRKEYVERTVDVLSILIAQIDENTQLEASITDDAISEMAKFDFNTSDVSDEQFELISDLTYRRLRTFLKTIKLTDKQKYYLLTGNRTEEENLRWASQIIIDSIDLSAITKISRQRIATLVREGAIKKIPISTNDRKILFYVKDILQFFNKNEKYPTQFELFLKAIHSGYFFKNRMKWIEKNGKIIRNK
jgi:hypothetical protein